MNIDLTKEVLQALARERGVKAAAAVAMEFGLSAPVAAAWIATKGLVVAAKRISADDLYTFSF